MIKGIRDVYYNVEDMERARAFYRDVLGFQEHSEGNVLKLMKPPVS